VAMLAAALLLRKTCRHFPGRNHITAALEEGRPANLVVCSVCTSPMTTERRSPARPYPFRIRVRVHSEVALTLTIRMPPAHRGRAAQLDGSAVEGANAMEAEAPSTIDAAAMAIIATAAFMLSFPHFAGPPTSGYSRNSYIK